MEEQHNLDSSFVSATLNPDRTVSKHLFLGEGLVPPLDIGAFSYAEFILTFNRAIKLEGVYYIGATNMDSVELFYWGKLSEEDVAEEWLRY